MADISKIKLGDGVTVVNLKDAKGRQDFATLLGENTLAALKSAAWRAVAASISDGEGKIADAATVKAYVDSQVGSINKFDVVVYPTIADRPVASADTMYKLALVGGESAKSGIYTEYITVRSGAEGSYQYEWEKIGTTAADLTEYVQKTTTIATIALDHNISVSELQAALGLGSMAYANTASGSTTLETIDSITMKSVTVSGDAAVTHTKANADLTKGDYTPAGSVSIAKDEAGTQISGSISKPAIDVNDTTKDTFVKSLKDGTEDAASFSEGTFTPNVPTALDLNKFNGGSKVADTFTQGSLPSLGTETKSAFATEGVTAAVGSGEDDETLIFTTAGTAQAVTAQGAFNAGALPTFSEGAFTPASLSEGFYTPGSAAAKAGDTFSAKKLPVVDSTARAVTAVTAELHEAPAFTGDKFKATFAGTEQKNILVTGVSYDKADATAAFSDTFTPEVDSLTKTAKTINVTVNPDAVSGN